MLCSTLSNYCGSIMPSAELNHNVAWCGPENSKPKSHYKKLECRSMRV